MLIFTKGDLSLYKGKEKEWIITNGLGSYSSSTILGLNTRKYHGLLVAALDKPLNRNLILSKFEEELALGNRSYSLSVNKYPNVYHPNGHENLEGFVWNIYPTFNYKIENIDIIKSICMVNGHNAVVVSYKIISDKECRFMVRPFVNSRGFHENTHEPDWVFNQVASQRTTVIRPSHQKSPAIIIGSDKADYKQKGMWINNMEYEQEKARGNDYFDNHFCPGEFVYNIKKGINVLNFLVVGDKVDEAYVSFDDLYSADSKEYQKFFHNEVNRIKSY